MQVTNAANVLLYLEVNTITGQVSIKNQTGEPVSLDYYEITSAAGSLQRTTWSSLQDQNLPGLPAGNGSGNGWEEGGGGGNAALSESFLTGNSQLGGNAAVGLGGAFTVGGAQDLVFRYGVVTSPPNSADFDIDGDVDGADFLTWQRGLGKADPIIAPTATPTTLTPMATVPSSTTSTPTTSRFGRPHGSRAARSCRALCGTSPRARRRRRSQAQW